MLPELDENVLDHIAIVVESLDKSQKVYEDLGFAFKPEREIVAEQGVKTAFAQVDHNANIELLEPYGKDGPIHKFIEKEAASTASLPVPRKLKIQTIKSTASAASMAAQSAHHEQSWAVADCASHQKASPTIRQ